MQTYVYTNIPLPPISPLESTPSHSHAVLAKQKTKTKHTETSNASAIKDACRPSNTPKRRD